MGRLRTNRDFQEKYYVCETDEPEGAGKGLFALRHIEPFEVIGIYEGGEKRTLAEVTHPDYKSEYVATVHGLVRDPYDPKTKRLLCDLCRIND